MSDNFFQEPMLDLYIFETTQLIEQLEQAVLNSEKSNCFTDNAINEIFRITHTIKGSSAMMMFDNIATLAHSTEDLFYFLRENKPENYDFSKLSDLVFESIDFIKGEVEKVIGKNKPDGDSSTLISNNKDLLSTLKENNLTTYKEGQPSNEDTISQQIDIISTTSLSPAENLFKAVVFFDEGCGMENIRAYGVVTNLQDFSEEIKHIPEDILENDESMEKIREDGFKIFITTNKSYDEINKVLMQTILMRSFELVQLEDDHELKQFSPNIQIDITEGTEKSSTAQTTISHNNKKETSSTPTHQSMINVNVSKLDMLMDLVGELVISEAMVTQNPDLSGLILDNFQKAARQHLKIINEIQDVAMSIRMVPLSTTFQKMNRIVRDMSKKLNKEVRLEIIGEETEVDKNIIEHISDPLMHLIRNSIDHGLESAEERIQNDKPKTGIITLEAKNAGGDVLIIVRDDGRGLNKEKILDRARENGLFNRPESELTDKEIYSYVLLPGFSTKAKVTEFSGRGVGMDVVTKNIGAVGGSISVDSIQGEGTIITLIIPLTLAIMDGMTLRVGKSKYTVPTISIKESFKPKEGDVITDPDSNEMIMIRGVCYPILRLYQFYKVHTEVTNIHDGIIVMVENEDKGLCIFVDGLIGEQQVVVKALPEYIKNFKKIRGLTGCTLLGDGSISLILDVTELINSY